MSHTTLELDRPRQTVARSGRAVGRDHLEGLNEDPSRAGSALVRGLGLGLLLWVCIGAVALAIAY